MGKNLPLPYAQYPKDTESRIRGNTHLIHYVRMIVGRGARPCAPTKLCADCVKIAVITASLAPSPSPQPPVF
jgi:hypothetical protein